MFSYFVFNLFSEYKSEIQEIKTVNLRICERKECMLFIRIKAGTPKNRRRLFWKTTSIILLFFLIMGMTLPCVCVKCAIYYANVLTFLKYSIKTTYIKCNFSLSFLLAFMEVGIQFNAYIPYMYLLIRLKISLFINRLIFIP